MAAEHRTYVATTDEETPNRSQAIEHTISFETGRVRLHNGKLQQEYAEEWSNAPGSDVTKVWRDAPLLDCYDGESATAILCSVIIELVRLGFTYSEIFAGMKLIISIYDEAKEK